MLAALASAAAPAVSVLELRVAAPGAQIRRLDDVVHGATALVAMAASSCPPCRAEVPVLARAARRWRSAGLRVLAVIVDVEDAEGLRSLARAWGIDYEVYAVAPGQEGDLEALLARGVPAAFLVKDGVVTRHDRFLSDTDLDALVAPLLGPPPGERALPGPEPARARHTRRSTPVAGSPVARAIAPA
ncbi:MAG TPA: redoxin domain-containing protein [Candidatus Binatia bacterium]|nr:redoxin domain-containing protein [Candidatus Binatia bacterium]